MVLHGFTRCYRMLHGLTQCSGCYAMLQGVSVIGFKTVLQGVTWALHDVTDKPLVSGRTAVDLISVVGSLSDACRFLDVVTSVEEPGRYPSIVTLVNFVEETA